MVTEPDFFAGDPGWIPTVRAAVDLPVLRKDFLVDPVQVLDAVLRNTVTPPDLAARAEG